MTPHAFITKVAGLSCSIEHGRYPWIPPEIGRPDGRNHTGEGSGVSRGRGRSTSKLAGDQGGGEMTRSTARRGARARLGSVRLFVDVTGRYQTQVLSGRYLPICGIPYQPSSGRAAPGVSHSMMTVFGTSSALPKNRFMPNHARSL